MKGVGLVLGLAAAIASVGVIVATRSGAQSPVKETLAYSRETIPGIPPGGPRAQNPFPTTYYIFVVIQKGTPIRVTAACIRENRYAATLKKLESPVQVERDAGLPTGEKDTLVKKTSDDVYQVELGEPQASACKDHAAEKRSRRSEVAVFLESGEAKWCARAEKIVPLRPAHAM